MSVWDRLKKAVSGAYDNVNIFDNGKTATNSASPVKLSTVGQLRDILDANSPKDVYNRTQAGQPADYRAQQLSLGNNRPHMNLGGQIFGNAARFVNTGLAAGDMAMREAIEQPRFQIARFTNNLPAQQAYFDRQRQWTNNRFKPDSGLFGEGTIFKGPNEVGNLSIAELSKRVGLNAVGTGLEVSPFAKGAGIASRAVAYQVPARVAVNSAQGVAQDLIDQYSNRDNISLPQLGMSALAGGGLPEVVTAIGKRLPANTVSIAGNQRGSLGFGQDDGSSIADILGKMELKSKTPAELIKDEFGGKIEDIQRNIDRYGLQTTNEVYQRVGKSGTANNVDAVATAELKKLLPNRSFGYEDGLWKAYTENPEAFMPAPRAELPPEADLPTIQLKPTDNVPPVVATKPSAEAGSTYNVYRGSGGNKKITTQHDLSILGNDKKYYAFDEKTAKMFGDNVESATVKLNNPLFITNDSQWRDVVIGSGNKYALPVGLSKQDTESWISNIDKYIRSQGYDGVVVKMDKNNETRLIQNVFGSDQVVPFAKQADQTVDIAPQAQQVAPDIADNTKDAPIELPDSLFNVAQPTNQVKAEVLAEAPKMASEAISDNIRPEDVISNLPKNADVADASANIEKAISSVSDYLDKIDIDLQSQNSSLEAVMREIQDANRNGTAPSQIAIDTLNNDLKPILDSAKQLSVEKGVNIGTIGENYLPQMVAGKPTRTVNVSGNLIDELAFFEIGSAKSRYNKISLDNLDYSKSSILDYVAQHVNNYYKDQNAITSIIAKEAEVGRVVDEEVARNIFDTTKEVANKIQATMQKSAPASKTVSDAIDGAADTIDNIPPPEKFEENINKLDVLKELGKIGDAKFIEKQVIKDKLSLAKSAVSSQAEIFSNIQAGRLNLSEAIGQELYANADAYANTALAEHVATGAKVGDAVAAAFDRTTLPVSEVDKIISKLNNIKTNDPENVRILYDIAKELKRAAGLQATDFAENFDIQDKTLRKLVNTQIARNITRDGYNRTVGQRLVYAFTGAVYRGALYFNVKSSVANVTELPRVAAVLKSDFPESFKKGLEDVANSKIPGREFDSIASRYGINERSAGDLLANEAGSYRNTVKDKIVKAADRLGLAMFNTTEHIKDATLLYGLEAKYTREGYEGIDLTRAVLKEFNKYAIKGGFDNAIGLQRNTAGRALFQFTQFPIKSTKLLIQQGKNAFVEKDREAAKYLSVYAGGVMATYATVGAVLGLPLEYLLGVFNPAEDNMNRDTGLGDEIVSRIPGGPGMDALKDIYFGAKDEIDIAKEEGRKFDATRLWNDALRKDAQLLVPGSVQINKTRDMVKLMEKGYDASAKGNARYAAPTDNYNKAMGLLFGKSTTTNAREYFGTQGIAGDLPNRGGDRQSPVSKQWQALVDKANGDPAVIDNIINRARDTSNSQKEWMAKNPTLAEVYKQATKITYDSKTGKGVSDVITPDKWKSVQSDTSLKLFEFMREKAQLNNKEFGIPLDPIYTLQDKNKIREIMQLRALPTGDDQEMKDILRGKDWYKNFEASYQSYIKDLLSKGDESDIINSPRKTEYLKLQSENPASAEKSKVMQQYELYKAKGDEESRKAFYKDNIEQLSSEYSQRSENYRVWTNKMRAIEGVDPISKEVWDNSTRGFEYDELSVAKAIAAQNGAYLRAYGGAGSGASSGKSGSRVSRIDYGNTKMLSISKQKSPPKIKVNNSKKSGKIKVSKGKIKI